MNNVMEGLSSPPNTLGKLPECVKKKAKLSHAGTVVSAAEKWLMLLYSVVF